MSQTPILDASAMARAITRMAHEIIEHNHGAQSVALVGIERGGVFLARRLAERLKEIEKIEVPLGKLDITLYRDDLGQRHSPVVRKTDISFDISDKIVVLVDDVLYTGRSIRAAMDALIDLGRPQGIQLAVLVDRGHRELPIRADYVGKNIPTALDDDIQVVFSEESEGARDGVCLVMAKSP